MEEILNPTKEIFDPTKVLTLARQFSKKIIEVPTREIWMNDCLDLFEKNRYDIVYYAIRILNCILKANEAKPKGEYLTENMYFEQIRDEFDKQSSERFKLLENPKYVEIIGKDRAEEMKKTKYDVEGINILKFAEKYESSLAMGMFIKEMSFRKFIDEQKALSDKQHGFTVNFPKERIEKRALGWKQNVPLQLQRAWESRCNYLFKAGRYDRVYETIKLLSSLLPKPNETSLDRNEAKKRFLEEYAKQSRDRLRNVKSFAYAEKIGKERAKFMKEHNFDIEGLEVLELARIFVPAQMDCYEIICNQYEEQLAKQNKIREDVGRIRFEDEIFFDDKRYGNGLYYREFSTLITDLKDFRQYADEMIPEDRKIKFHDYCRTAITQVENIRQDSLNFIGQDWADEVLNYARDVKRACIFLKNNKEDVVLRLNKQEPLSQTLIEMLYKCGQPNMVNLFRCVKNKNGTVTYVFKDDNPTLRQKLGKKAKGTVEKLARKTGDALIDGIDDISGRLDNLGYLSGKLGDKFKGFNNVFSISPRKNDQNNDSQGELPTSPNEEGKGLT